MLEGTAHQFSSSTTDLSLICILFDADQLQQTLQSDSRQHAAQPQEKQEDEEFDPYAPLDPQAKSTLPIKPFKKGRKPTRRKRPKQAEALGLDDLGESSHHFHEDRTHGLNSSLHASWIAGYRLGCMCRQADAWQAATGCLLFCSI